jgi:alpha-beta hydrolase superfamily lysophospholipase
MLLIHGLWSRPSVWTPWLPELNEAGYDAAALSWSDPDRSPGNGSPAARPDLNVLLRAARRRVSAFPTPPIVIGHGVGGAVAERLLVEASAAAAISLAPVPSGYPAMPTAAHLVGRRTRFALLGLRGGPIAPTFPQFRQAIANESTDAEAQHLYQQHVTTAAPRDVLLQALRHRAVAPAGRPRRGPLLLAAGGKDELIREMSTARLHRTYRRRQPDAVTDYKVFPGLDHTLGLGTPSVTVLFYCLDWLTAQNM